MINQSKILLLAVSTMASTSVLADSFDYQLEARLHYRDSDENRFPTAFPFPPEALPVGQQNAFLATVDSGGHSEISLLSLAGLWQLDSGFKLQFKIDAIDKYDRNPTSGDRKIDLDNFILRYDGVLGGNATSGNYYLRAGKFTKFERQEERRTESYGVVSTTFNRFEDSGVEAGVNLPNGLYTKISWTTGNPVFFRDPNALAGDNGTKDTQVPPENPDPKLKSGIVLLYDAEVEDLRLSSDTEFGAALGFRQEDASQANFYDVMAFYYERKLENDRQIHGTVYGSDLDLFDLNEVVGDSSIRLPFKGNRKREGGLNFNSQLGGLSLFAQYVFQDLADMQRDGYEVEMSYSFDAGIVITPVLRYSVLNNDFTGSAAYPAPSVWWDWRKLDYGINVIFNDNVQAILEYTENEFERAAGWANNNELLLTVRITI